jgi:TM2 domain-containing membrane protein YozV/RNA polymerase subunit RPABC4/transcription elongation factor Spt4
MASEGGGRDTTGFGDAYCISCGKTISSDAGVCSNCGVPQDKLPTSAAGQRAADEKYCTSCGAILNSDAEMCPECGAEQTVGAAGDKSRVAAGVLGILFGGLGAHRFYIGDVKMGVLYLCFFWTFIPAIAGFIEGIIYLTKSDAEFHREYVDAE